MTKFKPPELAKTPEKLKQTKDAVNFMRLDGMSGETAKSIHKVENDPYSGFIL